MKKTSVRAQQLKDEMLVLVDADAEAFNKVMEALRAPKTTEDQKKERDAAVEAATREATLVPFRVLELSGELLKLAKKAAQKGNRNSLSDAGVAALAARAAAEGAYYNIRINLPGLKDQAFKEKIKRRATALRKAVRTLAGQIDASIVAEFEKL